MKISIFGLGYVGTVSAACLASKGHHVIGVDVSQTKVDLMNAGNAPIIEPQLGELIQAAVKQGNLRATQDSKQAVQDTELSFVCVGTPSHSSNRLDLQFVEKVCEDIGLALKEKKSHHVVACRSTMFPGSIRNLVIPTLEKFSGKKAGVDFSVCINPEFMMEATAVHDFFNPPKNVVGATDTKGSDAIVALNKTFTSLPTNVLEIETAEFVKYCDNIWHALKVGYANEIGNMCKELGIDSHAVMDVFCQDTKLNLSPYYLKPGFAFGGSCLPKDLRAFVYESQQRSVPLPIISSVLPSNQLQIDRALKIIMDQNNKNVGFLGFSFKANTDDLRESPMIELIERLLGKGYSLTLYDKSVSQAKLHGANREYILNRIPHISDLMVSSIDEVLKNAKTIVIGNKAQEFNDVMQNIDDDHVIIDLVRIQQSPPKTKQYEGICW